MKQRCLYKKRDSYEGYGGRGIKVCDRWLNSFENFLEDMGKKPTGKSIDRINSDGHYEPNNCKWSTVAEQAQNRRTTKLTMGKVCKIRADYSNDKETYKEIAKRYRVSPMTIFNVVKNKTWKNIII